MAAHRRDVLEFASMSHLLLATQNLGKIQEIHEALEDLPIELLTLVDFPEIPPPEETGMTFAENATIKARHYHPLAKHPTVADDSGIIVEALQDELGIHTRRWGAGPKATDEEWIEYFLERMRKEENKRARFICAIAHVDDEGGLRVFEGTCEGTITDDLEADYLPGLPISACFKPEGYNRVFSGLSIEQKNSTSHRGRALLLLRDFLKQRH